MKKNKYLNFILIGVLAVASLLLALPFTPLRSSFTGIAKGYTDVALSKMGVDFGGKIKNAGLSTKARQYKASAYDFTVNNENRKRISGTPNYAAGTIGIDGSYSANGLNQNDNTGTPSGGGMGGFGNVSSSNKKKNNNTPPTIGAGIGVTSLSTSINTTQVGSTTKQGSTKQSYGPDQGGTHPGVDPIGTLPLGDGTSFMIMLSVLFIGFKMRKFTN
jgi:hypothetical protein